MTRRHGWRGRAAMLAAWVRDALRVRTDRAGPDAAEMPDLPPGGGDWTAHLARDGAWRLRDAGAAQWIRLDARSFHAFRAQVAAAGGCMLTIEEEPGDGEGSIQVRRRTVGYWLDGETRERPAVLRRRGGLVEYHFYRRGNPMGYERLGLAQATSADAAMAPTLPGVAHAA